MNRRVSEVRRVELTAIVNNYELTRGYVTLFCTTMIALEPLGIGKGARKVADRDEIERRGWEIVKKYQDFASDEGVFDDLFACLRRNLNAKKSMRVESQSREAGYSYETVEDAVAQIASARLLAQILRVMPQSAGVTVNNGDTQSLTITTQDRISELQSIGVEPEEIERSCIAMLQTLKRANTANPADAAGQDVPGDANQGAAGGF